MKQLLLQTLVYFATVFAIGFLFGVIRVLWLVPLLNERIAELIEAPFMLLAIYLVARVLVAKYLAIQPHLHFLWVGLLALTLLLSVEFTLVLCLRDLSLIEYISSRDPVAASVYIFSLIIYMLMPYLLARHRSLHANDPQA